MKKNASTRGRFSWETRNETQHVASDITQVYIELSTFCNLSCATCVRNSMKEMSSVHMEFSTAQKITGMLRENKILRRIVLFGYGEALCNPSFRKIVTLFRTVSCELVLITNAHLVDDDTAQFLAALPMQEIYISCDDDFSTASNMVRRGSEAGKLFTNMRKLAAFSEISDTAPVIGLEVVAAQYNIGKITRILDIGVKIGVKKYIISNLFPYSEKMKDEILYEVYAKPKHDLTAVLGKHAAFSSCRIAGQTADVNRRCSFIETGTVFITATGEVAPCPELAYSHGAYYFSKHRYHNRFITGSILDHDLGRIWEGEVFSGFRNAFRYWDFPDCTTCVDPEKCWHRTVEEKDCYGNAAPCGECLWAKNIVICP